MMVREPGQSSVEFSFEWYVAKRVSEVIQTN